VKAVRYCQPRRFAVTEVADPHAGRGEVRLPVFRRDLVIKGSFSQAYSFDRALQALRTGRVVTDGIVTHTFALDDYAGAPAALQDRGCVKAVVRP
jgi:threonine dehydrogenase-like Zn-dependent dehydrogenase